jgi:large subunit ribosomal protein L35
MPKAKTNSGAKKRFRARPGGTVKRGSVGKRHLLVNKSSKRKAGLSGQTAVHSANMREISRLLKI